MFYYIMGIIMFRIMWNDMKDWNEITPLKILLIIFAIALLISLIPSCGITKTTTHNCELMEQGQKCLPNHSCCKK